MRWFGFYQFGKLFRHNLAAKPHFDKRSKIIRLDFFPGSQEIKLQPAGKELDFICLFNSKLNLRGSGNSEGAVGIGQVFSY